MGNTLLPTLLPLPGRRTTSHHGSTGKCETACTYLFLRRLLLSHCFPALWLSKKKGKLCIPGEARSSGPWGISSCTLLDGHRDNGLFLSHILPLSQLPSVPLFSLTR